MITSHRRIKFTAFSVWQSFIFFARKNVCKFYPFASASLAPTFWHTLPESLRRLLNASLTPKPPLFLRPQTPKTCDFTVKFAQISLPPCLLCAASGLLINLYVTRAKFTRKHGKIYKISWIFIASPLFELCAPDFPPKRHKAKNHGLKTKFKRRESAPRI